MRSVFLIFEKQEEKGVTDFLDYYCDESFINGKHKHWNVLKNSDGMFYINEISADGLFNEMEDKSYFDRLDNMKKPIFSLQIDISGRHDGTIEIKELLKLLFAKTKGYAVDDYTNYFWTIEEIENDVLVKGHTFFDYNGWYEEYKKLRQ